MLKITKRKFLTSVSFMMVSVKSTWNMPALPKQVILVDVSDETNEIWRIIHPEDASQIPMHLPKNGYTRYHLPYHGFPVNLDTGCPRYSLYDIGDAIYACTGLRPVNTYRNVV